MKYKDIAEILNRLAPEELAYDWDNVGLLVGDTDKEVNKIYITLDLTDEILDEAIEFKADMIISHHPLIFKGLKCITDEDFISKRILKLIRHNINYYAMHTNFDVAPLGMANIVADKLGLRDLEPITDKKEYDGQICGTGRAGVLEQSMPLEEFIEKIKIELGLSEVKLYSNMSKSDIKVKKIAVLPGSGRSEIETVLDMGAEVYVTGDITHHEGIDAVARGLTIIDAGHYGTEFCFCDYMSEYLKLSFAETVKIKIATYNNPMKIR